MRPAQRIAILLLVGTAATVAGEAGVRIFTRVSGRCHPVCMIRHDDTLGWSFSPRAVARHRDDALGFDVTYHLNRDGYRSADYPRAKPASVTRLVVIGDSNGFGWGVADDQHFAALLDAAEPGAEVVNLSVSGYGTDQEYLRLTRDGLPYAPDVVVLQVTPNDVADLGRARLGGRVKPRFSLSSTGALRLEPRPLRPSAGEWLLSSCYACEWLRDRLQPDSPAAPVDARIAVSLFRPLVSAIGRSAAAAGARLVVVHAAPELDTALANLPDITLVDVTPRFTRAREQSREPLFPDGLHWNRHGHQAVADALREVLVAYRGPDRPLR